MVFHLRVANEDLVKAIQKLPFVKEVKAVENKLLVNLDDPETHNPDVVRTLVGAGADIQFVGELRHSLEDVYLQLVKNA